MGIKSAMNESLPVEYLALSVYCNRVVNPDLRCIHAGGAFGSACVAGFG